jgi:DNA-binding NarL/FixJ family response regulator
LKPDLILLDVGMPNLNGLEAARQILSTSPEICDSDPNECTIPIKPSAKSFAPEPEDSCLNPTPAQTWLLRSRLYKRRGHFLRRGSARWSWRDILIQLLAEGRTSKEVAVSLNLSVKTAETHRTNLMRKLGLHSVADLTRYAVRNGIVHVF